ncbi:MAG TPA: GDSL-type esterase/lipase family protein [Candidatus Saccharimonadales bacterium]
MTAISTFVLVASVGLPALHVYADAVATSIAGQPGDGPLVDNILATSAQFWNPSDVLTTSDGTIYIADKNHNEVRSIASDGIIRAAFGNGVAACGTGNTQTGVYNPTSLAKDEHDNIFIATGCGEILEFTPGDTTATVVAGKFDGSGNPNPVTHDGMLARDVTMQPSSLTYDTMSGTVYFYDGATQRILSLNSDLVSIVAGTGTAGFSGDGGQATAAQLSFVGGLLFANGNLYVSDSGNCRVRVIGTDGVISTIIGDGTCQDQNDNGPGVSASMQFPGPLAMDANEMLYVAGANSGSIYAYDTQAKNIMPVIGIISNDTGLAIEPSGNLLALHSGVNQQLYRITGLPTPTPPADGKQHGRVTSVSWSVGPTTALWTMDVTVKTTGVLCPGVVVVNVGGWQKRASVCTDGQSTGARTTTFKWKVFNDKHVFQPGSTPAVTAFVARSDAARYGGDSTTLAVPVAPTLVGVGDSYVSGHNQTADDVLCKRPDNLPADDTTCGLHANDPAFSWVTRLAAKLGNNIPAVWQYDYDDAHLLARSGATTAEIFTRLQAAGMVSFLQAHQNTWNVVVFSGGANDIDFGGALKTYYNNAFGLNGETVTPWNVTNQGECPDSTLLYNRLSSSLPDGQDAPAVTIQQNLQTLISQGKAAAPSTRFINMLYPYVVKSTNVCSADVTLDSTVIFRGSASVVNALNDIHRSLAGPGVLTLDAAAGFSDNPLPKLQLIRFYGYPHPNDAGQNKLATMAFKLLKQ